MQYICGKLSVHNYGLEMGHFGDVGDGSIILAFILQCNGE